MVTELKPSLEKSLARTEEGANTSLRAAQGVLGAIRKIRNTAKVGNLKELRSAMEAADKAEMVLRQQMVDTKTAWDLNEETYLSDGSFIKEILELASQKDLHIFERDERLFCYPVLLRVSPAERAVMIDKNREKRIRPSFLVSHLKELQKRPPRFRPESFLESLYDAYETVVALRSRRRELVSADMVVPLIDLYELFTLLPGISKEYSKQEFTRDIYLLHRSGVNTTRRGAKVSFPSSTGTKLSIRSLHIINEQGEVRIYYGISFSSIEGSK